MKVQKEITSKKFTGKMQANLLLVFCAIFLCLAVLIYCLFNIVHKDGERYGKRRLAQQVYSGNPIPFKRGNIIDRNNTTIATSEKVYKLIFDVKQMMAKEKDYRAVTVDALVEHFDLELEELNKLIEEKPDSQYNILKRYLTYEEVQPFKELLEENKTQTKKDKSNKYITGIWFEEEYRRKYPLNTVGSDFVGFTFGGNEGNSGLEQYYNTVLNGTDGIEYGYYNSDLFLERTVKAPVDGKSLILTIDVNIQKIVEKHIKEFSDRIGFEHMGVIIMNPNNGEVYAMAADGEYDLNNPRDLSGYYTESEIEVMSEEDKLVALEKIWRNYLIHDEFSPGSTIKPFTIAMGFEEGLLTGNETYICDGYEMFGTEKIPCVNKHGHGNITLKEALMKSCNDVLMQIADDIGRKAFAKYQENFNFGLKTGIDLIGERTGTVFPEERLNGTELATSSFGQSLAVTMIQMAANFSALVNGGYYYEPHLVKQIINENGVVTENADPTLTKEIVSSDTSEILRDYLFATVEEGTAKGAKVSGYKVGGKTGTAEKYPREEGNYIVSFLGLVPADNPEVVIYVVIDEPKNVRQDDSSLATVKASEILTEILPFLEIFPEEGE